MTDPFEDQSPESSKMKSKVIYLVIAIVIILILVIAYWYYDSTKTETVIDLSDQTSEITEQDKVAEIISKVSRHITLPVGSEPLVATIMDAKTKALEQAFYEDASDGDKLLIFSNKVIIYNPSRDIIVSMGEIKIVESVQEDSETEPEEEIIVEEEVEEKATTTKPVILNIDIRNGSGKTGAAQVLSDQLNSDLYNVINVGNASKNNYESMVIVNLTGKDINELVTRLGVTAVQVTPEGEEQSTADVLIIIGR